MKKYIYSTASITINIQLVEYYLGLKLRNLIPLAKFNSKFYDK